jgi:hypothetical protein
MTRSPIVLLSVIAGAAMALAACQQAPQEASANGVLPGQGHPGGSSLQIPPDEWARAPATAALAY